MVNHPSHYNIPGKKECIVEMEEKFAEIDKRKKFEYYAQIDDDFKELYLEYTQLRDENTYEDN